MIGQPLLGSVCGPEQEDSPPVQFRSVGMVTVMLKSWVLAWEKPLVPGTLLVTVSAVCPVAPRVLPVGSMSHYGMMISIADEQRVQNGTHGEGTGAVCVHLVDSDRQLRASLDLGDSVRSEGVLGVLSNVDVAAQLCASALVHDVCRDLSITDESGILLARADAGAVPGKLSVD